MSETITVLGLGNILCADDGFGVRAAERFYAEYMTPEHVQVIDGGTQGPTLYQFVEEARRLLVFDAVDFGLPPGALTVKEQADIPVWLGARKMSAHQNSFSEVLALAALKKTLPESIVLIGVQPVDMTYGAGLSDKVRGRVTEAVELGRRTVEGWGARLTPAQGAERCLNAPPVSMGAYEETIRATRRPQPDVFQGDKG